MSWIIWTDGSSRGNPGPGGWGTIIASETEVEEVGGGEKKTTNNRMELQALIEGLRRVPLGEKVDIYLDSQYVKKGSTEWLGGWQRNGWQTSAKQPVENQDLWEKIAALLDERKGQVHFHYQPGHHGIPGNERADTIATTFADEAPTPLYKGPRSGYSTDLTPAEVNSETKTRKREGVAYSYVSVVDGVVETHFSWMECEDRVKGKSGAQFKKVFSADEEKALIAEWSKK